ncbi:MAG: hypothetical protein ACFE0O_02160 [Opitutales bacterium]
MPDFSQNLAFSEGPPCPIATAPFDFGQVYPVGFARANQGETVSAPLDSRWILTSGWSDHRDDLTDQ